MSELPFMRIWWDDFFADPKVAALPGEAKGVYLLLLGRMWLNGGWLPNNDALIAKRLGLHHHTWRLRYRPLISPLLTRGVNPGVTGGVLTQKRLTKEMSYANGRLDENKALLAKARAAKAAKAKQRGSGADKDSAPAVERATTQVDALGAGSPLPHKKAGERPPEPSAAGPDAPFEVFSLRPVPLVEVEAPSDPALVKRLVSDGIKRRGASNGDAAEPTPDRGGAPDDHQSLPEPERAPPGEQPATGLFGLVEAARRRKEDGE